MDRVRWQLRMLIGLGRVEFYSLIWYVPVPPPRPPPMAVDKDLVYRILYPEEEATWYIVRNCKTCIYYCVCCGGEFWDSLLTWVKWSKENIYTTACSKCIRCFEGNING